MLFRSKKGIIMSNVGIYDRVIRMLFGAAILYHYKMEKNKIYFLGLIPLVTGMLGWCPIYQVAGLDSTGENK